MIELFNSNNHQKISSVKGIGGLEEKSICKMGENIAFGTRTNIYILNKTSLETIRKIDIEGKMWSMIPLKNEDFLYFDCDSQKFIVLGKDANYAKTKEFTLGNDFNHRLFDLGNGKIVGDFRGRNLVEIYNY